MSATLISRRRTLCLLASTPLWGHLVSACAKTEPDHCNDVSALSEEEKTGRTALQYVDKSPDSKRICSGCSFYQASKDPAACGGCQVVKGPIHPKGFCVSFAAKT